MSTSNVNSPNLTSTFISNRHDWKLSPNVQVKIILKKLEIQSDNSDIGSHKIQNGRANPKSKSTPVPRGYKRKRMSSPSARLPAQTETETIDPHLNPGQVMQELQKIVLEFEPDCNICCKFVSEFSQHIHNLHSLLSPSASTHRPRSQGLGSGVEIETKPNISSLPEEIIPSLAVEYVKCEPGEIEITENDDLLHNVGSEVPEGRLNNNVANDFCTFDDDDESHIKDEGNDSHTESEFRGEYLLDETVTSPATTKQQTGVRVKNAPSAAGKHVPAQLEFIEGTQPNSSGETEPNSEATCQRRSLRKKKSINYAELNEGPPPTTIGFTDRPVLVISNVLTHPNIPLPSVTAENIDRENDMLSSNAGDNENPLFTPEDDHNSDNDHDNSIGHSVDDDANDDSDSDFENSDVYTNTIAKSTGNRQNVGRCKPEDSGFPNLSHTSRHVLKRSSDSILKKHPNVPPYECGVCHDRFTSSESLAVHKTTHSHNNVEKVIKLYYKCKTCWKFYGSPSDLIEHNKVHTWKWKRTHKCQTCGKIFLSTSNLIQHSKCHIGQTIIKETHKCETCGKYFSKKCVLTMHKRLHTGKKPFKCTHCDKCFLSNTLRIRHERSHIHNSGNNDKTADRKIGDRQLIDEGSVLNVHVATLTHTGEESTKDDTTLKAVTARLKNRTCEKCDIHFYTTLELNRHNYRVHNIRNYPITRKHRGRIGFQLRRWFLNQRRIQTDKELHICEMCGKCFSRIDWFIRHKELHARIYHYSFVSDADATRITNKAPRGKRMKEQCNICRVEFPSVNDLNTHMMLTHKNNLPKQYKCNICKSEFSTSAEIRKHFLQIHPKMDEPIRIIVNESDNSNSQKIPYKCDHCIRTFELPRHLEFHMSVHGKEKPHKCETCEKSFYVKDVLINHHRRHRDTHAVGKRQMSQSNKNNYACGFCSFKYPSIHRLTRHIQRRHSEILCKEYVCKFCKKEFFSMMKLSSHVRQEHPGEKQFQCEVCHKEFTKRFQLIEHSTTHREDRTIPCTYEGCTKMFKKKAVLKSHLYTHTGETFYKCDQCEKSFISWSALGVHNMTHTGKLPFMCEICSKCFATKPRLELHLLIHKEEGGVKVKPHVCKDCGRGFTRKGQLTAHSLTHTGEKSHLCEECGICFRMPHQLRRHLKTRIHANPK